MNSVLSKYRFGVLVVALMLASCSKESALDAVDPISRPVKLIEISNQSSSSSTRYPALIGAAQISELSFPVGGLILQLPVNEADVIEQGGLIAKLDPRDFKSDLTSAQASYANVEDEYQRAVRLAAQDAIAKNVLEQRRAQRDVAKAQLDSAEKALADSILRAPFSGVIASINVREQQAVSSGSLVATVINVDRLEATINVPAGVIAQVPVREDRGAVVLLEAAPDRAIEASYSEANLIADATSQTYAVTFTFEAPENLLVLPGMNATVVLSSSSKEAASESVSIPLTAIQSDSAGQYVWIVDQDTMTVARRDIRVAPGIGEHVIVTMGLSSGDRVVGAGGAYLAEGVKVTPWAE